MASISNYVISLTNVNSKTKSDVGIPALELGELLSANVPIPNGFVITQAALEHFAFTTQLDQKVKQLQQMGTFSESTLSKLILESELPKDIYNDIQKEYSALSGISNMWMRIRAGLYDSEGVPLTFIDENEINEVKGLDALELELKKLWAKLLIIDQKYDSLGSFIIIQKLVPAEVSGVILTQDMPGKNPNNIIIQSVFGELRDDVVESFDTYVFSKTEEKIIDRSIVPQKRMYIKSGKNDYGYEMVEISDKWQMRQKLSDKYVEDLGYLGDYLENVFGKPQEVAWIYQAGKIWINYVKPITEKYTNLIPSINEIQDDFITLEPIVEEEAEEFEKDTIDIDLDDDDIIINEAPIEEVEEIKPQSNDNIDYEEIKDNITDDLNIDIAPSVTVVQPIIDVNVNIRTNSITRDILAAGVGNNKGIVEGKISFNRETASPNDILVLNEWDDMPKNVAGIIIEDMLHVDSELPVVYGAELASKILRDGEYIRLDTDTGFIFELPTLPKDANIEETQTIPTEESNQLTEVINTEPIVESNIQPVEIPVEVKPKKKIIKKVKEEKAEKIEHVQIVEEKESKEVKEIEKINTAIKVLSHVYNSTKDGSDYSDGYIIDLPHANELFNDDKIDYKNISNQIQNYTLPILKSTKGIVIYNIFDLNPVTYIKNTEILDVQCEAIHRLRSKENLRNLHIALPKFKNIKQMREFRQSLSAAGLRRSTTFKIFIKASYSSNIFELPQYLEDKFDGVIVSIDALHNSLFSSDKKMVKVTNTLVTALQQMYKECKEAKVPMILDLKGVKVSKTVMEKLNPFINFAVSVPPKDSEFTKHYIADLEKKRIFK